MNTHDYDYIISEYNKAVDKNIIEFREAVRKHDWNLNLRIGLLALAGFLPFFFAPFVDMYYPIIVINSLFFAIIIYVEIFQAAKNVEDYYNDYAEQLDKRFLDYAEQLDKRFLLMKKSTHNRSIDHAN